MDLPIALLENSSRDNVSRNNEDTNTSSAWSDAGRALGGIIHGGIDFVACSFLDIHKSCSYIGSDDMDPTEMRDMLSSVDFMHSQQMANLERLVTGVFSIDPNDAVYSAFRSGTKLENEMSTINGFSQKYVSSLISSENWERNKKTNSGN